MTDLPFGRIARILDLERRLARVAAERDAAWAALSDDGDGNWKSSQSFGRDESFLAIHCLEKAVERTVEEEGVQNGSSDLKEEAVV
ncbi:hypothetical protein ACFL09_05065 [Planctomycetota bacterium]